MLLAVPTTAMGATLPLLTQALSRSNPNFGATLGKLYGWNTLGAMLGAIATETLLVRFFGIVSSGLVAMLLNLAAGALALRLVTEPQSCPSRYRAPRLHSPPRAYRYLVVALLSGAVMLALEVVWFRFLLLTYMGTGLTFALMLAIVLAGIGLGGLAAGRLANRDEQCHRWLPHVTALCALLVVATYYGFDMFTAHQSRADTKLPEFVGFALFLMLPGVASVGRGVHVGCACGEARARRLHADNRCRRVVEHRRRHDWLAPRPASCCYRLSEWNVRWFALAAVYCGTALLAPMTTVAGTRVARSTWGVIAVAVLALALFPFGLMERSYFNIVARLVPEETLVAKREGLTEDSPLLSPRHIRHTAVLPPRHERLFDVRNLIGRPALHEAVRIPAHCTASRRARCVADQLRRGLHGQGAHRVRGGCGTSTSSTFRARSWK